MGLSKDTKLSIVIDADADDDGFIDLSGQVDKLGKSLDGLKEKAPVGAFDRFKDAMKGVAGVMTPFNQGLELAKKALGFAEEGLDAYAKTSVRAAEDVKALKEEFAGWRDLVLESAGALTVALLKPATSIDAARDSLAKLMAMREKFFKEGIGGFVEKRNGSFFGDDETKDPGQALSSAFSGFRKTLQGTVDTWNTDGVSFVDGFVDGMKKTAEASKKAADQAAAFRKEIAALASKNAKEVTDDLVKRLEAEQRQAGPLGDNDLTNRLGPVRLPSEDDWRRLREQLAETASIIEERHSPKTMLQTIFGPIEEFDAYTQSWKALGEVFGAFQQAMAAGYQALVTGSQPVGKAMRQVASDAILAAGTASVIDGARELALGVGSLALGPIGGVSAAAHFKSAALHAGVAVAAGLAAHALAPGGGGADTDHRTAGNGGRGNGGTVNASGTGARGSGGPSGIVVVYADPFAEGSPGVRRRNAQKVLDRAKGGRDWEDS